MKDRRLEEQVYDFLRGGSPVTGESGQRSAESEELKNALLQIDELSKKFCAPDKQRMWKMIYRHAIHSKRKRLVRRWSAVAAVFIPIVLATVLLLHFDGLKPVEQTVVIATSWNENHQVRLYLNDGSVVEVQNVDKDSVVIEKGAGIFLDTTNSIVYKARRQESVELVYNTLHVPRCCEYHLVLADGTQVWMNSDSELRFPVDFVGDERRVYLRGEAYFQVARNADKPFRVEASEMVVEALGTSFDVNSYRDGELLLATLVEGSVKVSLRGSGNECVLTPGEQAVCSAGLLNIVDVNINDVIGWKDGRFVFSNMTLEEISGQLERWYDVQINFQDVQVRKYRFTGVMKRYNRFSQLIELIEETANVRFMVDGKNVLICRK